MLQWKASLPRIFGQYNLVVDREKTFKVGWMGERGRTWGWGE